MNYYIYILASQPNGTLYVGRTENLLKRVEEHRRGYVEGFTRKHHVHQLVHFEAAESAEEAAMREWQLKNWRRDWKKNLIERDNPQWQDLYPALLKAANGIVVPMNGKPHAELVSASTPQPASAP